MGFESPKIVKVDHENVEKWSPPSMSGVTDSVFKPEQDGTTNADPDSRAIPTAEEIENWHKEAHQEGYQQGLMQAQQETAELRQRLFELINFFEHPLQALNEEVEQQLTHLAVTLAQQLVRREIRLEPGEIVGLIRDSIQMLPANSRKIRIQLNPEDAAVVRDALQMDSSEEEQSWKLVEDRMISRGGCVIKSDQSVINATIKGCEIVCPSPMGKGPSW